jgi:hypothetical protein
MISGLVLLMGAWGGRRLGFSGYDKELADCQQCLEILRPYEKRCVRQTMCSHEA